MFSSVVSCPVSLQRHIDKTDGVLLSSLSHVCERFRSQDRLFLNHKCTLHFSLFCSKSTASRRKRVLQFRRRICFDTCHWELISLASIHVVESGRTWTARGRGGEFRNEYVLGTMWVDNYRVFCETKRNLFACLMDSEPESKDLSSQRKKRH